MKEEPGEDIQDLEAMDVDEDAEEEQDDAEAHGKAWAPIVDATVKRLGQVLVNNFGEIKFGLPNKDLQSGFQYMHTATSAEMNVEARSKAMQALSGNDCVVFDRHVNSTTATILFASVREDFATWFLPRKHWNVWTATCVHLSALISIVHRK